MMFQKVVQIYFCRSDYETYALPVCINSLWKLLWRWYFNFNRIVPGTIRSVLNNERPVIRSNGTMIRDYLYIEDGTEAYITLAEQLKKSKY